MTAILGVVPRMLDCKKRLLKISWYVVKECASVYDYKLLQYGRRSSKIGAMWDDEVGEILS